MDQNWLILMAGSPEGGGSGYMLVWFGLMFVLLYLVLIRPQRKRQKEHNRLLTELKKGDKVVTNSGLFGTIFAIDEDKGHVILNTRLRFLKNSIAAKVDK